MENVSPTRPSWNDGILTTHFKVLKHFQATNGADIWFAPNFMCPPLLFEKLQFKLLFLTSKIINLGTGFKTIIGWNHKFVFITKKPSIIPKYLKT